MSLIAPCFTFFNTDTTNIALPEQFTFPFCYQPSAIAQLAVDQLQQHLSYQRTWVHNFGEQELHLESSQATGKMFGVLVVKNPQGQLGYLAAFSGKVADRNLIPGFVPPVFDMLTQNSFFLAEQAHINDINSQVEQLSKNPEIEKYRTVLTDCQQSAEQLIEQQRQKVIVGRKRRKQLRHEGQANLSAHEFADLQKTLAKDSVFEKNELLALKQQCEQQIALAQAQLDVLVDEIAILKAERKSRSTQLQHQLFKQYQFLNGQGELKNLQQLFQDMPHPPPAGSGECAAPKLLHYAYKNQLTPIAMAEFWWGKAPKSEIRQHKNYYPACQGKCQPILSHMLEGLNVEENPLLNNPAQGKPLPIIYQDDDIVIVNKPAEFLSVPGKTIEDSVYYRMKLQFPKATGNLIVHRLDMSTSGLMVIALSKRAHKSLQKQFIARTVTKQYVALVDGKIEQSTGTITLPLAGDYYDRPRQMVCFEEGKPAETTWQVLEYIKANDAGSSIYTKVKLFPKTGRTHQLRVHCAHQQGLGMPIIGDDLYGVKANRLHLHAQRLELDHPITKERISFEADADF